MARLLRPGCSFNATTYQVVGNYITGAVRERPDAPAAGRCARIRSRRALRGATHGIEWRAGSDATRLISPALRTIRVSNLMIMTKTMIVTMTMTMTDVTTIIDGPG